MQVEFVQKAGSNLKTIESAQAPAVVQPVTLAAATKSQDVEKQLLQAHPDICLSKKGQDVSNPADRRQGNSAGAASHAAAGACSSNLLQKHNPADPAQAAIVASADINIQILLALRASIGKALSSQTGAQEMIANPVFADLIKLVKPVALQHVSQGHTGQQTSQPAEPLQVCLLALPPSSCT